MKISLFAITTSLLLSSCGQINYDLVGEYDFVKGQYTSTMNGNITSNNPYWVRKTYSHLMNICTDKPYQEYSDFLSNCVVIDDLGEEDIKNILEDYDIITSTIPIKSILKDTEFTRQDACEYLYSEPVEVVLDEENANLGKIYLYKIKPKGKYRFHLCP